jgi:hypothetical protein
MVETTKLKIHYEEFDCPNMLVRLDWERNCYEGHLLNELYYRREKNHSYIN